MSEPDAENNPKHSVLIVGAGASGLTAGYDLKRDGYEVTILEATSNLGGRLKKLDGFTNYPINLGGEFIHVHPRILDKLVDDPTVKVDVETVRCTPMYAEFKTNGTWTYESTYDPNYYAFKNYCWHDFFKDYIAQSVADDIVYNCPVTFVDYSSTPVVARCSDGREWSADYIIVTASLKVLQDRVITFSPSLPGRYQDAIRSPVMPPGIKIFLKFREKFYKEAFEYRAYKKFSGQLFFWDESSPQDTTDNILGIFSIGRVAEYKYTNLTDEEIVKKALEDLDMAYDGKATPNLIDSVVQNWKNEEYVRGAYSLDFPGGLWPISVLKKPVNDRLLFAGEAIPDGPNHGYAHGAALSGRRAANEIKRILSGGSRGCLDCFWDILFEVI